MGQTHPRPPDPGAYYTPRYYGNRHGIASRYCVARRVRFVRRALGRGRGRRLLDIGCGDGSFLLAADRDGWSVAGTELNPARARAEGLDVREGLAELPERPPVACATLWHTLEHLPEPVETLRRLAAMLEPGGAVLVAVPDWGGLQARASGRHWVHLDVPRHLYHFTAKSLECCLRRAGLIVERLWHQEFEYDLLGWSQSLSNGVMGTQNAFFDLLTGKAPELPPRAKIQALALGTVLSAVSLPLLAAGTLLRRGGSLIAVARPSPGLLSGRAG